VHPTVGCFKNNVSIALLYNFRCESVFDSIWPRESHQSSVVLNQRGGIDSLIRVTSV